MNIIFMGTPEFAVLPLEGLIKEYGVSLVVSQPDKMVGRHKEIKMTPVKEVAVKNNIEVFQPMKIRDDFQKIIDLKPDLIVTCAYGQIVPKEILDCPKYGCINIHASLLPKLRGGAPIHKAIIDGYSKTGITIMYMDEKMDNGDIISQVETPITDADTLDSLQKRLSVMGKDLILKTIPSIISKTSSRIPQDLSEVTYAYNVKREEEHIDFSNKTSREIFNQVRGLCPSPLANVLLFDQEMKVIKCYDYGKKYDKHLPGEIVEVIKEGIVISTIDGSVVFTEIKPFGKKAMTASSYLNGVDKNRLIGQVLQ